MTKERRALLGIITSGFAYIVSRPSIGATFLTPSQMTGPFYPNKIPLDHDNDLTRVVGYNGIATGDISHIVGHVLNPLGRPVVDAQIEIWQCDAFGQYKHPRDGGGRDPAFQGYGRTKSSSNGEYRFKTIKPVTYPGRTPHIHMRIVSKTSKLVTQIYVKGEQLNNNDFILNSIHDAKARKSLIVPFAPKPNYPSGELVAYFNPVIFD